MGNSPPSRRLRPAAWIALAALVASCGQETVPANEPLDWTTVTDRQMILVTTTDPEGMPRTTRLWIVVMDGSGYLRSADTKWSRDVDREPDFLLIVDGRSHPVRGTRVPHGTDEHARVMAAFSEKYGWLSRIVLRIYALMGRYSGPESARILRLDAVPGRLR